MKINSINAVCFKGKIIDSHMHNGFWNGKNFDAQCIDKFLKSDLKVNINGKKDIDNIEKVIVASLNGIGNTNRLNEVEALKESIELFGKNEKVGILAICQPNLTQGDSKALEKAIEANSNSVIGLKFHPTVLNDTIEGEIIRIKPKLYKSYLELAQKKKLPCLFHCDGDFSKPTEIYELAKQHKNVPIILGHSGGSDFQDALKVIEKSLEKNDAKLYCDISWLNWGEPVAGLPPSEPKNVISLIKRLKEQNKGGLDRILFGTDAPLGCFGEELAGGKSEIEAYELTISNLKTAIKKNFPDDADEIIDKIFYKNAQELFFEKNWVKEANNSVNSNLKNNKKLLPIISFIGLGILAIVAFGKKYLTANNKNSALNIKNPNFSEFYSKTKVNQ